MDYTRDKSTLTLGAQSYPLPQPAEGTDDSLGVEEPVESRVGSADTTGVLAQVPLASNAE